MCSFGAPPVTFSKKKVVESIWLQNVTILGFYQTSQTLGFPFWTSSGLNCLCDLLEGATLMSFSQVFERNRASRKPLQALTGQNFHEKGSVTNFSCSLRCFISFWAAQAVTLVISRDVWEKEREWPIQGWSEEGDEVDERRRVWRCTRKGVRGRKNIAGIPDISVMFSRVDTRSSTDSAAWFLSSVILSLVSLPSPALSSPLCRLWIWSAFEERCLWFVLQT